jgi:16S rRNA (adenine1518-N6/adenine1519-N6)-dimethyltransferase
MKGTDDGLPPLRSVIQTHGLQAKKSLGQNFILDLNLTRRIARTAVPLDVVVEVGPGPGGLTRALLLEGALKVIAIERDDRCIAALKEIQATWPNRLDIIEGDALAIDFPSLLADQLRAQRNIQIVSNLPYNIGTALYIRWLGARSQGEWPPWWSGMSLMFQKEVAERAIASAKCKAYGRLSILTQWRCSAHIAFEVNPKAFIPVPKVTSALLRVIPETAAEDRVPHAILEKITAAAFGQRRKMLRSSLKSLSVDPIALCNLASVEPEARAESVTIDGFCALARAYAQISSKN